MRKEHEALHIIKRVLLAEVKKMQGFVNSVVFALWPLWLIAIMQSPINKKSVAEPATLS
jgi:hypothetical protein